MHNSAIESTNPIIGSAIEIDAVGPLGLAAQPAMARKKLPNGRGSVVISLEFAWSAAFRHANRQNGDVRNAEGASF
jgi:hypothetical protein